MRKDVSLWLDGMRATASFLVFVAHLSVFGVAAPELARFVPELGHDSVILFFVLSGFVIAFTTESRHASLSEYLVARGARLWSVAVPALALTYGLAALGRELAPLAFPGAYQLEKLWIYVPFELLFLGELWTFSEPPLTNIPWWSLGYEAWYYLLFALAFFYRGLKRGLLLGVGIVLAGPKLALLLPTWVLGALIWRHRDRCPLPRGVARALLAGTVIAYLAYKSSGLEHSLVVLGNAPFGGLDVTPLGSARSWVHDWLVAAIAGVHLHALGHAHVALPRFSVRPIRWFASFTFSLYLAHAPLLIFASRVVSYDKTSVWQVAAVSAVVLAIVIGFGYLTEHRKGPYRRALDGLVAWTARRIPRDGLVRRWLGPDA